MYIYFQLKKRLLFLQNYISISRTANDAASTTTVPKKGLKRLNGEDKAGADAAIKRARTVMGAPAVGGAKKTISSASTLTRKPLASRNTLAPGGRSISGSALNKTVASAQPSTEKPKSTGKISTVNYFQNLFEFPAIFHMYQ